MARRKRLTSLLDAIEVNYLQDRLLSEYVPLSMQMLGDVIATVLWYQSINQSINQSPAPKFS